MSKILIAEDDELLVGVLKTKLEERGYECVVVETGQKLVDELDEINPDLLMLDIFLPGKNGLDALEEIKKDSRRKDLPVLIVSNLDQREIIDRGLKLGAVDYIVKTEMALEGVLAKVDEILGIKRN